MTRAVVFAYHDVGVRCLSVLLAHGIDVPLVISHRDNPNEHIWFASVAELARIHGIEVVYSDDLDSTAIAARLRTLRPEFIFSFYFRHMIGADILGIATRGALNMHGSLLPKYRGRVPVNWAVIQGESETGASLHYMVEKPDAGDLVDQQAVPILPDDTAVDVFRKVTVAAELTLHRSLPALLSGIAPRVKLDLTAGSYFGGRKPEDGRIEFTRPAREVHNLVRGVAPPYPGAFTTIEGETARVLRTHHASFATQHAPGTIFLINDRLAVACGNGQALRVLALEIGGHLVNGPGFHARYGATATAAS